MRRGDEHGLLYRHVMDYLNNICLTHRSVSRSLRLRVMFNLLAYLSYLLSKPSTLAHKDGPASSCSPAGSPRASPYRPSFSRRSRVVFSPAALEISTTPSLDKHRPTILSARLGHPPLPMVHLAHGRCRPAHPPVDFLIKTSSTHRAWPHSKWLSPAFRPAAVAARPVLPARKRDSSALADGPSATSTPWRPRPSQTATAKSPRHLACYPPSGSGAKARVRLLVTARRRRGDRRQPARRQESQSEGG